MDLRQRKRLSNIPKYTSGADLDAKVGFSTPSQQDVANDLTKMVGSNAPAGSAVAGAGSNNASFVIGQKPASKWNNKGGMNTNTSPSPGQIINTVGSIASGLFDQSSKFTNGASNTLGQISSLASNVPGPWGQAVGGVFKLASNYSGMANYSHSGQEMMNQAGTTENMINGIGYTQQNVADTKAAYNDVSKTGLNNTLSSTATGATTGAAIGSIIPGLGTVAGGILGGIIGGIGSLFGASKARRRQNRIGKNAIIQTDVINSANMASADTQGLENRYYANNYDTTGGVLYANRGKDLKLRKRINRAKV